MQGDKPQGRSICAVCRRCSRHIFSYFLFTFMGAVPQEPLRTVLRILGDVTASS